MPDTTEPRPPQPSGIVPDTKDWTWVLQRTCGECGTRAGELGLADLPELLRRSTVRYGEALRRSADVAARPSPATWSVLEYACHVRDVHRVFAGRLELMLSETDPTFPDWDQDRAAVEGRYSSQDPLELEVELVEAAGTVAGMYAAVRPEQEARRGLRSNGSEFTVLTLGQYHLHDVLHHLHDIGWGEPAVTAGPRS